MPAARPMQIPAWSRVFLILIALLPGACGPLSLIVEPTTVSVALVNNASFPVEAELYYSDEQDIPELLLVEFGTKVGLTIPAGRTRTITRDCDALQSLILRNAALQIIGDIGPEANTDVLRDADDFRCGAEITMTFSHSDALLDFDVRVTIQ